MGARLLPRNPVILGLWNVAMTAANWQNNFLFARQPSGTCGAAEQSVNTSRPLATNSEFAFCEHVLGAPIASLTDSIRNGSPTGPGDLCQNNTLPHRPGSGRCLPTLCRPSS